MLCGVWTQCILTPTDSQYLYERALHEMQEMYGLYRAALKESSPIRATQIAVWGESGERLYSILERFLSVLLDCIHNNLDMDFGGM